MTSFRGGRLGKLALPTGTVWLLTEIAEAPQLLKALREAALVQSVESSNRIEGVTVAAARLRPLVVGQARPQDRPEEEIQGYCQALNLIHTSARELLKKQIENEIVEFRRGAAPIVRFRPVSVANTPAAVDELCLSYRHALSQESAPALVAVGAPVRDFLCIHPFRDGNGRVARLLTLLALYHHGYEVGRYITRRSIEAPRDGTRDSMTSYHGSTTSWASYVVRIGSSRRAPARSRRPVAPRRGWWRRHSARSPGTSRLPSSNEPARGSVGIWCAGY